MEQKNYRLIISNYYEWKNFKGKGMSVTVICDGEKRVIHGDGYGKFGKLIKKVTETVYHEH